MSFAISLKSNWKNEHVVWSRAYILLHCHNHKFSAALCKLSTQHPFLLRCLLQLVLFGNRYGTSFICVFCVQAARIRNRKKKQLCTVYHFFLHSLHLFYSLDMRMQQKPFTKWRGEWPIKKIYPNNQHEREKLWSPEGNARISCIYISMDFSSEWPKHMHNIYVRSSISLSLSVC